MRNFASQDYTLKAVRSAAILTTSYVAGTTISDAHLQSQLVIYVDFTIGSLTSAEVKVEFSDDNSTFYQETFSSVGGGTSTLSEGEHTVTATGSYRIAIPIKDRYIKISAKGTGTVTDSSMTINASIGT
jgi:hypothetical protein